jgi:hypothetical protein
MASPQDLSKFSSKDDLLEAVDYLMDVELGRTGSPWVSRQRLCELFVNSYGFDLEKLANFRSCGKDLKSFLSSSRRFAIYNDPQPMEYYIALRQVIFPGLLKSGRPAPRLRRGFHEGD